MSWLWPELLYLLLLVPLILAVYIWMIRRRRRFAVRYSSLALIREVMPAQSRWRRHLPFGLLLLGLAGLLVAVARPVAIVDLPTSETTIILTIDVSRSMCSTDIQPSRLGAAEAAALSFVKSQAPGTRIGIVAFSSIAELIQAPTTDQAALEAAIQSLRVGSRTAIGNGILQSIDAIAEGDPGVAPSVSDPSSGVAPLPVPKGDYVPDIIVLLTDGASNVGPLPLDAAHQAADRGVRIYTIGFGTPNGSEFPNCGQQVQGFEPNGGGAGFGGGGFNPGAGGGGFNPGGGGGGFRRGIDEATLKQIASLTGGSYYSAESAGELQKVFTSLPTSLIIKHGVEEISVVFAAFGTLLAGLAILLALLWHPLP
jgi:Ca-activated chloride channel family protein